MIANKTILVAALNWGLGHATRCIPLIDELILQGFTVIVASDGAALQLLQKEYPKLESITLPSYKISYPKKGRHFRLSLLLRLPVFLKVISEERKLIAKIVIEKNVSGIISDNRWGVRNKFVTSVFLTHQVNVFSGVTSKFSSKIHQKIIRKFDHCWVPDFATKKTLSGTLGHLKFQKLPLTYIGPLSRIKIQKVNKEIDILLLLSGPEPQRSIFEKHLFEVFKNDSRTIVMVRGVVETIQKRKWSHGIENINFLKTKELESYINKSELIVCRSGYTTIMDLFALEKMAFFIPTPGQYEQLYLAKRLSKKMIIPSCSQENFRKENLLEIKNYSGFKTRDSKQDFKKLFSLFHSK